MTPRRARIYTWLFIGLAGCASINVMLFQQRLPMRGIGGAYGESAAGGSAIRIPQPPMASRPTKTPASSAAVQPSELVQAIQRELSQLGAFSGTIDGRPSRPLVAAIADYEGRQGLAISGEATDALLKRLILGGTLAPASAHAPGEIIAGSAADNLLKWVVDGLNRLGHDAGRPQAKVDARLQKAIRSFETAERIALTGRITERLVRQLERRLP